MGGENSGMNEDEATRAALNRHREHVHGHADPKPAPQPTPDESDPVPSGLVERMQQVAQGERMRGLFRIIPGLRIRPKQGEGGDDDGSRRT